MCDTLDTWSIHTRCMVDNPNIIYAGNVGGHMTLQMDYADWFDVGEVYQAQIVMRNEEFMDGERVYYANKKLFHQITNHIVNELVPGQAYYVRIGEFETFPHSVDLSGIHLRARVAKMYDIPARAYTFSPPPSKGSTKVEKAVTGASNMLADAILRRILA